MLPPVHLSYSSPCPAQRRTLLPLFPLLLLALLTLVGSPRSAAAAPPTLTTLFNFTGSAGFDPMGDLVQGTDGNFYGVCSGGGNGNGGTIFSVTPGGILTVLHTCGSLNVNGANVDGTDPEGGLIQGSDGKFYGMCAQGGASGVGTLFAITSTGVYAVLHTFTGPDGANPYSGLLQGPDGNFYGTTLEGGALVTAPYGYGVYGGGTVFVMTPSGTLTTLHSFAAVAGVGDNSNVGGAQPRAGLARGSDGNFYGTTFYGGAGGRGTLFSVTPAGAFTSLLDLADTGVSHPYACLLLGRDGSFYGSSFDGGTYGDGTLFRLTLPGTVTILHNFTEQGDSVEPAASLYQDPGGTFYGTARGFYTDFGALFSLAADGTFTVLAEFTGSNGAYPGTTLVRGLDGNLYGLTENGGIKAANSVGVDGNGTFFRLNTTGVVPGSIALGAATYAFDESAGYGTVTFKRLFGRDGTVSVRYATADGTALADTDYLGQSDTLTWADGDSADKQLAVFLVNRGLSDGSRRSFTLTLSNPSGGATLGNPPSTVVNILEDDPVTAPMVSSASASAQVGAAFTYQIVATQSPTGYAATGLPAGLSTNTTTGLISGAPTATGTFPVTLYAANAAGTSTGTLSLMVTAAPVVPPVVTSAASAAARAGTAFAYQITATNSPTSYGATGLPTGLTVNAGMGLVSGTPVVAGTFPVTLSAANAGGTGTANFSLVVAPGLPVVTLTAAIPQVTLGGGGPGEFMVTLSAPQDHVVLVNYTIKGTAINGTDYLLVKGTKKFKPGKTNKPIRIYPEGDLGGVAKKVVTLVLAPGDGYTVGTTGKVKVKILAP